MGVPALRPQAVSRTPKSHLRVAKSQAKRAKRSRSAQVALARQNFRLFVVFLAVIGVLGLGRVWLTVQATEASLEASDLRDSIKSERYEGDMLEVRQSALGSPSRIRAIAGKAMDMAPARDVTYLDLTAPEPIASRRAARGPSRADAAGFESVLARVMDLTAGEAEVLLVGDVGLTSTQ